MQPRLDEACQFLKGVGPRRAEALERLGIATVEDLLLHLPRNYYDRRQLLTVSELKPDALACVRVRLESLQARTPWRGRGLLRGVASDDTGSLRVVWFNTWARDVLKPGNAVVLCGVVQGRPGRLEMQHPEFERVEDHDRELVHSGRIVPLYGLTQGITQKWLRTLMRRTLESHARVVQEVLPPVVRGDLPERGRALRDVHFPAEQADVARARQRLALEELFFLQLLLARRRSAARAGPARPPLRRSAGLQDRYLAQLPFQLTGAQRRVLEEIYADLESGCWMRRLVQGDVGSGKTVIAAAALFMAAGNGQQGVLMAPTEALAIQHAERLVAPCAALGVRLGVLVGSRSERDKEEVRARMASGDVDLVVGTHAVIQEPVCWARLGLAVVDEQQRFGVLQRGALQRGALRPHVLVLTATPIPRSLALTLFGDLEVSRLDEKPPGRRPVRTHLVPPAKRDDLMGFVRRELEAGRQAYVVLPLIDESDKIDLRAATDEYERLRTGPLAGLRLGLLHGRLAAAEKESLLADFRRRAVQLLVSTTIVEVGLDVANATLMIVHHPERFGLSQLHQLRGRVGRGRAESFCFLLVDADLGDATHERLREFAATEDGFRIAELDLRQRGPGDFVGTRQHGLPALRVADLARDLELLERARAQAFELVDQDPHLERPEHAAARLHLESRFGEQQVLAEIG
jgi:ATP-dependent DNA helicase RecG